MTEDIRYRFFFKGKSYLIPKDYIDNEHPGGGAEIMPYVGKDMTDAFEDADHSLDAEEMLEEYRDEAYDSVTASADPTPVAAGASVLQPEATTPSCTQATELSSTMPPPFKAAPGGSSDRPDLRPKMHSVVVPIAALSVAAAAVLIAASLTIGYGRFTRRR